MTLLVTGGGGFVMSVVVGEWLARDPANKAVILDRGPLDGAAERYFAPVRERLTVIEGDVCEETTWKKLPEGLGITAIVHGATLTPISRGSAKEARREPEAEDPAGILDVNLMGTVRALEWGRRNKALQRFIYVSSGSVYRHHGPDWQGEPLPEDGYVAPLTLYGISKFASEMVVNRYADLFGLAAASVRLSSIYGPMDRVTASRSFRHVPNRVAHMALAGEVIRPNSLDGAGDFLSSVDVAAAIIGLIQASRLRYRHYNVASGEISTIGDFVRWAGEKVAGVRCEVASDAGANVVQDATMRDGMWGAYDTARLERDTGWRPRPLREAFHAYMDWVVAHELGEPNSQA